MYIGDGGNCFIHMRVIRITHATPSDGREVIFIEGSTKQRLRNMESKDDTRIVNASIDVLVTGYLKTYVENEIDSGDNLFVIAAPTTYQTAYKGVPVKKTRFKAECIYKEDFLKYFPNEWRTIT